MNILQVCAYAAPYPGNFIKSLVALEKKLNKIGHNTYYAFPETAKGYEWCKELEKNTKVFFLPLEKARINPKTYIKLRNIIKNNEIDIVHSHFELYDIPISTAKNKKIKMFWHLHDAIENDYNKTSNIRKLLYKLHYSLFSKDAFLISVSEKHRNFAVRLGLNKERSTVILNGTDLSRIRKINTNEDKKYDFLIFGWDFERKGVDLVIQASEKLYEEGYKFNVAVVGSEDTWKHEAFTQIKDSKWLIKQNFVEDINELYNNTKVFLHPSRAEGCSYAAQESVYSGLQVISSDIPENLFLRNVPSVTLFENNNYMDLYVTMKEVLDGKVIINENDINRSREIIDSNFSIEVWADKIIKEYFINSI